MLRIWLLLCLLLALQPSFGEEDEDTEEDFEIEVDIPDSQCKERSALNYTVLGGLLVKAGLATEEIIQEQQLSSASYLTFTFRNPVQILGWSIRGRDGGMFGPLSQRRGFISSYVVTYVDQDGKTTAMDDPDTGDDEFLCYGNLALPETITEEELNEPISARKIRFSPEVWSGVPYMYVKLFYCGKDEDLTEALLQQEDTPAGELVTPEDLHETRTGGGGGMETLKSAFGLADQQAQKSEQVPESGSIHAPSPHCVNATAWRYARKPTPVDQFSARGNPQQAWRAILGLNYIPYLFPTVGADSHAHRLLEIFFRNRTRIDALKVAGLGAREGNMWGAVTKFSLLYKDIVLGGEWSYYSDGGGIPRVFETGNRTMPTAQKAVIFHLPAPLHTDALGIYPHKWSNKPYFALDILACYIKAAEEEDAEKKTQPRQAAITASFKNSGGGATQTIEIKESGSHSPAIDVRTSDNDDGRNNADDDEEKEYEDVDKEEDEETNVKIRVKEASINRKLDELRHLDMKDLANKKHILQDAMENIDIRVGEAAQTPLKKGKPHKPKSELEIRQEIKEKARKEKEEKKLEQEQEEVQIESIRGDDLQKSSENVQIKIKENTGKHRGKAKKKHKEREQDETDIMIDQAILNAMNKPRRPKVRIEETIEEDSETVSGSGSSMSETVESDGEKIQIREDMSSNKESVDIDIGGADVKRRPPHGKKGTGNTLAIHQSQGKKGQVGEVLNRIKIKEKGGPGKEMEDEIDIIDKAGDVISMLGHGGERIHLKEHGKKGDESEDITLTGDGRETVRIKDTHGVSQTVNMEGEGREDIEFRDTAKQGRNSETLSIKTGKKMGVQLKVEGGNGEEDARTVNFQSAKENDEINPDEAKEILKEAAAVEAHEGKKKTNMGLDDMSEGQDARSNVMEKETIQIIEQDTGSGQQMQIDNGNEEIQISEKTSNGGDVQFTEKISEGKEDIQINEISDGQDIKITEKIEEGWGKLKNKGKKRVKEKASDVEEIDVTEEVQKGKKGLREKIQIKEKTSQGGKVNKKGKKGKKAKVHAKEKTSDVEEIDVTEEVQKGKKGLREKVQIMERNTKGERKVKEKMNKKGKHGEGGPTEDIQIKEEFPNGEEVQVEEKVTTRGSDGNEDEDEDSDDDEDETIQVKTVEKVTSQGGKGKRGGGGRKRVKGKKRSTGYQAPVPGSRCEAERSLASHSGMPTRIQFNGMAPLDILSNKDRHAVFKLLKPSLLSAISVKTPPQKAEEGAVIEAFVVQYRLKTVTRGGEDAPWILVKNEDGNRVQVFKPNVNKHPDLMPLLVPVRAREVRIIPEVWSGSDPVILVDLLGC